MKVLQIVADGRPGGGTTNVLALSEDLSECGVDVTLCSQRDSYALEQASAMSLRTIRNVDFFRSRIDTRVVQQVAVAIDQAEADLVHVHGGRAALAMVRGAARSLGRRSFYTVRGYHFYRKPFGLQRLAKHAEARISRFVSRTIHVCSDDRTTALKHGLIATADDSRIIRNGIRLADLPNVAAAHKNRRRVCVLGRLCYQKNPDLVLDIAKVLAGDGFHFDLVGGGDLMSHVRGRVENERISNVTLHGDQPRHEALNILARCGTFLLASRWEGLPIAPVEAMAMQIAVVVSDVNGNREVVRDGLDGHVVPNEEPEPFANALRDVVTDDAKTDAMVQSADQRVRTQFLRQRVVEQHLELYEETLRQGLRRVA